MIGTILSFIFKFIEGRWVINQTKKAGVLFYLRFLAMARQSLIGLILIIFAFQVLIFSVVGLVLTGIYLAPLESEAKVWVLFGVCCFTLFVAAILMAYAFSEKTWLQYSGANEMIAKLE